MEEILPYILFIVMWTEDNPRTTMGVTQEIVMNKNQCEIRANETLENRKTDIKNAKIEIRTFCLEHRGTVDFERFKKERP